MFVNPSQHSVKKFLDPRFKSINDSGANLIRIPSIRRPPNPSADFLKESIRNNNELLRVQEFTGIQNIGTKRETILDELHSLLKTKTGYEIFQLIDKGKYPVRIELGNEFRVIPLEERDSFNGVVGTSCNVIVDLNQIANEFKISTIRDLNGKIIPTPFTVALAHELIHSINCQRGQIQTRKNAIDFNYANLEEELTISTGEGPTENKLRKEMNLPLRYGHSNHQS